MNMNIKFSKKSVWDVAGGTATDDGVASRGIKKKKKEKKMGWQQKEKRKARADASSSPWQQLKLTR